jgi:hypothetical protein
LLELCERDGLHCHIEGDSWYYPGATIQIVVETKEQADRRLSATHGHRYLRGPRDEIEDRAAG